MPRPGPPRRPAVVLLRYASGCTSRNSPVAVADSWSLGVPLGYGGAVKSYPRKKPPGSSRLTGRGTRGVGEPVYLSGAGRGSRSQENRPRLSYGRPPRKRLHQPAGLALPRWGLPQEVPVQAYSIASDATSGSRGVWTAVQGRRPGERKPGGPFAILEKIQERDIYI